MKDFRYMAIVAAAALGLAVAGCGSSSDDDTASTPTVTPPTQAELDAEKARADAAEAEAKRLQDEKDREQAASDLKTARMLFTDLREDLATRTTLDAIDSFTRGDETLDLPALKKSNDPIAALGSFKGTAYEAPVGADKVEHSAVVYSTQGDPTTPLFSDEYTGASGLAFTAEAAGKYTLDTTATTGDKRIASPDFPQEAGTLTYADAKRTFRGTFQGAAGEYQCTGDTCTAQFKQDGGINLAGTWTFDPDDNARVRKADTTYLSFGWWLAKGEAALDAGPILISHGSPAALSITTLEGTATYKGHAAGKYAIYSGAFSDRSEAGHFTAAAELKADWDGTNDGSISGTIDGFMTATGPKDEWSVELQKEDLTATGAFESGIAVWKIGKVSGGAGGSYSGNLYEADTRNDGVPKEAGGTFSAPFEAGVGQMIGAFAATRDKQ